MGKVEIITIEDTTFSDDEVERNSKEQINIPEETCKLEDSLTMSLNVRGCVDIYYMAGISKSTPDEVVKMYKGKQIIQLPGAYAIHQNDYEDWVLIPQYLGGNNLKDQLREAEIYSDMCGGIFDSNIDLIKDVMPDPVSIYDIHTQLGASWITEDIVADFTMRLLKLPFKPKVTKYDGKWKIDRSIKPLDVLNKVTYGTMRMDALAILEHILNASTIKIKDEIPWDNANGYKAVVNRVETLLAQEKMQLIIREFYEYCHDNEIRMRKLSNQYNEKFCYVLPKYDGSFLKLADINPGVELYKHQKDAIARILLSGKGKGGNTVLAHDVGSGKTFIYICAIHELYRLSISKKNMIVVPNNVFSDAVAAHKFLYPQDKILSVGPDDFGPDKRDKILDDIKNNDYTAIYMAYSKFDMLSMSMDYYKRTLDQEIMQASREYSNETNLWIRSYLSSKQEKLKKKRDKILKEYKPDSRGCFDKLGITTLVVDECHNYKNMSIDTKLEGVIGMRRKGSVKADSLHDKVRYIQKNNGRVVFCTGTLLTNSIADLFIFQDYLQPDTLANASVSTFGEWANTFGSIKTAFEVDVDSQNFRYTTRLAEYNNLPELMSIFGEVCDFYHISGDDMKLPTFNGYKDVVVKKTAFHEEFNKRISERVDDVRSGEVSSHEDNILMIITDGRKCALDPRIIDESVEIKEEDSKAGACAKETAKLYFEHPGTTQIIFCDYSTPKRGFNVYDEVKKCLIKRGVKTKDIAFIHEGTTEKKKEKLLKDLENGKIRIMLGSTQKLGVGVNVQKNLLALHHLDAPWRPSDLSQREGRLIRQGNQNEEVFIYRYMTNGSFDSYVWQLLENKQRFIGSFLAGSMSEFHRTESEIDTVMLDYSEVKALALGNTLIRDRIETYNQLERARISKRQRYKQLNELDNSTEELKRKIKDQKYKIAVVEADRRYYNDQKEEVPKEERVAFGEELLEALNDNNGVYREQLFDNYQGFEVILPKDMTSDDRYILIRRHNGGTYKVDMNERNPLSVSKAIDGVLISLPKRTEKLRRGLANFERQLQETYDELARGNPYDDVVDELEEKLEDIDKRLSEELEDKK